ncbi:MAG: hypothetical protein WBP81_37565 [Solirubrobacteraceae bacterium]
MSDRILTASDVEAIVEAIVRKVVEIVVARSTMFGLVDARALAEELGVSIDYAYAHAAEPASIRPGSGRRRGSASILTRNGRRWTRDARGHRGSAGHAPRRGGDALSGGTA